jgi:nitrate reductase / nitrite oxidoreductase, alpha subunit
MTKQRRIYGPYRLRYPMLRTGWKEWADDGYPYLTPALRDRSASRSTRWAGTSARSAT